MHRKKSAAAPRKLRIRSSISQEPAIKRYCKASTTQDAARTVGRKKYHLRSHRKRIGKRSESGASKRRLPSRLIEKRQSEKYPF